MLLLRCQKGIRQGTLAVLETILHHVGIGNNMLQWINSVYDVPFVAVKWDSLFRFQISKQYPPLSLLIFILTLEPLLRHIRDNPNIQIITDQHKLATFADDLLFFITIPKTTIPNLLKELDSYARLSNYKINLSKSEALNVTIPLTG